MPRRDYSTQKSSERKIQLLNDTITMLKNLIEVCEEIKDGSAETTALKNHNISKNVFRNLVFNEKLGFKQTSDLPISDEQFEELEEDENLPIYSDMVGISFGFLSWEERLFCTVFGTKDMRDIPPNLEITVPIALDKLSEKERLVLIYRFKVGLTLEETAEVFAVTRERIRQIEARALRRMRHPSKIIIMSYGYEYYKKFQQARELRINNIISNKIEKIDKEMEEIIRSNDINKLFDMKEEISTKLDELGIDRKANKYSEDIDNMFIGNFFFDFYKGRYNITARPYNSLKRSDINTVGELRSMRLNDMRKIGGLGEKGIKTIIDIFDDSDIYTVFGYEYHQNE